MNLELTSVKSYVHLDMYRKSKICCIISIIATNIIELATSVVMTEVSLNFIICCGYYVM